MKNLERSIAQLDTRKKEINSLSAKTTDADALLELQIELEEIIAKIDSAEERWSQLFAEVEGYS
jgi:predicted  nucleic acid-binding Zn-ribbon protein